MKDEIGGVGIKEIAGLKPKMYSFLVEKNIEHKIKNGVNKNAVATIMHND